MKAFSEFDIKPEIKSFQGDKVSPTRVLDKMITVLDYEIRDSKFAEKGNGKCLFLQIEMNGELRVVFTGSVNLQDMIQRVPKDGLPFTTKIVRENLRFEFR